jgi:hypothetical protein
MSPPSANHTIHGDNIELQGLDAEPYFTCIAFDRHIPWAQDRGFREIKELATYRPYEPWIETTAFDYF